MTDEHETHEPDVRDTAPDSRRDRPDSRIVQGHRTGEGARIRDHLVPLLLLILAVIGALLWVLLTHERLGGPWQ